MRRHRIALFLITILLVGGTLWAEEKPEDYLDKGLKLYESKKYSEAAESFQTALKIKPDYLEAQYNLAITYWTQKDYQQAAQILEEITKKAPETPVGKKAATDLKRLKNSGVLTSEKEQKERLSIEISPEIPVTSKQIPELIADLKYGVTKKRLAAAKALGGVNSKESIEALIKAAFDNTEKMAVRSAAVLSLARIKNPQAIAAVDRAIGNSAFSQEDRFAFLVELSKQNTPEVYRIILKYWTMKEWPQQQMEAMGLDIARKEWPQELNDPTMWDLHKKLSKEDMLNLILSAYPGAIETSATPIPPQHKNYIAYYNLMTGYLGGSLVVPVLVQHLKEDYPVPKSATTEPTLPPPGLETGMPGPGMPMPGMPPPPMAPPEGAPPGFTSSIVQEELPAWTLSDEVKLRVDIVSVLGKVAGESQIPFFRYLSQNDPMTEIQSAAKQAIPVLEERIVKAKENYEKGKQAAQAGKAEEAISLFELALKGNPDASYRKEIDLYLLEAGFRLLAEGKKDRATSLLRPILTELPTLNLSVRKTAEGKYEGREEVAGQITELLSQKGLAAGKVSKAALEAFIDLALELNLIQTEEIIPEMFEMMPGMPWPGMPGMPMPPMPAPPQK